ncbi:MAG: hypothetical protein RMY16_20000 [Nostoc sp. DedQUE12b]|uniref:hypothetical protein n=1 Tax=Nostoc sp. DedQUE12b TaxID=3075398 RepID=UPI002AD45989|nr:hypothetical protein [Nostoc sp. DedQUE12b]MDZ8087826.1 hypothetical protein [Nostoc sp. DedQUE12b]
MESGQVRSLFPYATYVNENITHHFYESNTYSRWSDRFIQDSYDFAILDSV